MRTLFESFLIWLGCIAILAGAFVALYALGRFMTQ